MNALHLSAAAAAASPDPSAGGGAAPSFGTWIKAGAGFALGAGAVYVLAQVVWIGVITYLPALWFLHALAKF